jgi:penicillin G amidase
MAADSSFPRASNQASSPRTRRRRWPRPHRWSRIVLWTAGCVLALLLLAFCAFLLWLRSVTRAALPQLDGDVHLAGLSAPVLSAPVIVRRDAHGVPHIDAATQDDLFLAQGYVTAQDRFWQMDMFRRNSEGTLAEVLGRSLLLHDETQRVLGIARVSQRIYDHLAPQDRAFFDDYARGVNLYIAQHRDALPPEFRLLHYTPAPWTGVDSIAVSLMMVQTLDTRAATKLGRGIVEARLHDPKLIADLYPVGSWRDRPPTGIETDLTAPESQPPSTHDKTHDENKDEDDDDPPTKTRLAPFSGAPQSIKTLLALLGLPTCDGCVAGSNEWVIAGSHTASGKPLLANDMHLAFSVPGIWYMADLNAPGFHAAGVTLPGTAYVIAGHNEHVAWGFTALLADVQDLYYEKLDGKDNYEGADGQWHPLAVDREVIHVRGGNDVILDVQSTAHGPLVNPLLAANGFSESRPLALKWNLYDPTLEKLPLYQMDTASNWAEFSAALAAWCWPALNAVYADDQGHIAYHAVGKVPLRPNGMTDAPIADNAHEWQGYIPFDDMPSAFDPPSGFLATANSRVTTDASHYPLSDEWIDPYRIERIYKTFEGRDQLTPKDMLAVQTDIYSELDQEMGQRFAYAIDHTGGPDGNGDARMRQAADLLRSWDGRLSTDSAAASVETQARAALGHMILAPRLGNALGDYHWAESTFAEEEIVMHAKPEWLPPGYKNWDALLTAAVRQGMENGHAPANLDAWTYGSWHTIDIEHPLARFLPFLGPILGTGPQPISGDSITVKQIGSDVAPSQRFTMDWSNVDGSTENIVLGESGNPLSPYFRDQWSDWYSGTTFALPFTPGAVAAQARHTLRLTP